MPLPPGTRLGPYEIKSAIGAGGMGEVYRARDTRLDRDIAIKILPEGFASDVAARERFQREAKSIAALNHPNICTLHDIGQDGDTSFLVMELVEGETLATLIERGPVPLAAALTIAGQIADALDKAHRAGIAHRDLKPANVMLIKHGGALQVKLLDFGLAKPAGLHGLSGSAPGPTMTASAPITAKGSIVGTLHYMAPEQLEGKDADTRSDIWAFGCVLYEMLTGSRPFDAKSSVGLMAAILEHEPAPMATRQPLTPPALEHIVTRCLVKDPEARWQSARDLAIELRWISEGGGQVAGPVPALPSRPGARWAMTAAVAIAAALLGIVATRWLSTQAVDPGQLVTFDIDTTSSQLDSIAASPDGKYLVYATTNSGVRQLVVREMASTVQRVLPGTDGAAMPFWSPDSESIAFFTTTDLMRIGLAGAAPARITQLPNGNMAATGSWSDQGQIVFGQSYGAGLWSVSHQGGPATQITSVRPDQLERTHVSPRFLPGGRAFLYLRVRGNFANDSEVVLHSLDGSADRVVLKAYSRFEFAAPNWLLYTQGSDPALVAQRFDPETGALLGDFKMLVPNILRLNANSPRPITASPRLLAFRTGKYSVPQLTWLNRGGVAGPPASAVTQAENSVLSAAGDLIASNGPLGSSQNSDVWVTDTRRNTVSRLTFDGATDSDPVFSPDGRTILFYSAREPSGIYRILTGGGVREELVASTGLSSFPRDWSLDGRNILYDKGGDIWLMRMGSKTPEVSALISDPGTQLMGHFSPDTRKIAYVSDETGRSEIFVQNFPLSGTKWQVSSAGGVEPRWRADGRELFFLGADGKLMAVDVSLEADFKLGLPHALFQTRLTELPQGSFRRFSVADNGQRFLMNVPSEEIQSRPITVIVNWQKLLEQKQ